MPCTRVRDAYKALYTKIEAGLETGKVWLTIKNGTPMVQPTAVAAPVAAKKTAAPLKKAA